MDPFTRFSAKTRFMDLAAGQRERMVSVALYKDGAHVPFAPLNAVHIAVAQKSVDDFLAEHVGDEWSRAPGFEQQYGPTTAEEARFKVVRLSGVEQMKRAVES